MSLDATSPASDLAAAIRHGRLKSRDLLEVFIERIAKLDDDVHSVVTLDLTRARAAADEADRSVAAGNVDWAARPLHGLPITIKDAIETEGLRSTGGARELADHVPAVDAPVVAKLKRAGAVVFGKTNLPRWSGDVQTWNDIFGTTNNPHDHSRVPGGSSGGAAAAVALGLTSFDIGTDIGGSVRIPSHFCGVFGLKPSFGVVSQRGYLDHVGGGTTDVDINVFGPIARSAADLALIMSVIVGPPPELETACSLTLPKSTITRLKGLRVGLWLDDPACRIDHEYHALLTGLVDQMRSAGAHVADEHPPVDFAEQTGLFTSLVVEAIMRSLPDPVHGSSIPHRQWLDLDDRRVALRKVWAEWFLSFDVLLLPVTPTPAFAHQQSPDVFSQTTLVNGEERPYVHHAAWAGLIGVLGLPSVSAPIGRTAGGLPVGVQVVTPYLHDLDAVAIAGLIGSYERPLAVQTSRLGR